MSSISSHGSEAKPQTVYLDLTHLGRHVTGIERIAIELFENQPFAGAVVRPVQSGGVLGMVIKQQIWLPLLALFNPRAQFVFPGFPPSPLFLFARNRVTLYVHDLFLVTRRQDLSTKARLYMAWPFKRAVTGLRNFLVNSEKTRSELAPFVKDDASIALYRPGVRNVFGLEVPEPTGDARAPAKIRVVSVGTVEPRKNYLAAAAIVSKLNTLNAGGAVLDIVGRAGWGPDAERLAGLAHVKVHGFLEVRDAKRVIEEADVYLCTSHDEGLGLPLLEVQYAGLPVVAPDQAVFHEVLGTSAAFVDPGKPDEAAAIILELVSSPGWRGRASKAARANVERWNGLANEDGARARVLFAKTQTGSQHCAVPAGCGADRTQNT